VGDGEDGWVTPDKSNGYEEVADDFMSARNLHIGPATVREWSRLLPPRCSILDVGCGHGVPISQVLIDDGFTVYGIDASAKLIAAFRKRFPDAPAECAAIEDSEFFRRTFDGVMAWGLMFLLSAGLQPVVLHKIARVLEPGGNFLFTSPREAIHWNDSLTHRESVSLGAERYRQILCATGLVLVGEQCDAGDNHYYFASKPPSG
jgi:2-polyprenyl-3-methyl-5-hydroxy-6-metoxy-1,4-benzoquinol methylase